MFSHLAKRSSAARTDEKKSLQEWEIVSSLEQKNLQKLDHLKIEFQSATVALQNELKKSAPDSAPVTKLKNDVQQTLQALQAEERRQLEKDAAFYAKQINRVMEALSKETEKLSQHKEEKQKKLTVLKNQVRDARAELKNEENKDQQNLKIIEKLTANLERAQHALRLEKNIQLAETRKLERLTARFFHLLLSKPPNTKVQPHPFIKTDENPLLALKRIADTENSAQKTTTSPSTQEQKTSPSDEENSSALEKALAATTLEKVLLAVPTMISATSGASGVSFGMQEMSKEEKILGIIPNIELTAKIIPVFYLLKDLVLYGSSTVESMRETLAMLKSGKTPSDWPTISNKYKKFLVNVLALLPVAYATLSDGVGSVYYFEQQKWSASLGIVVGLATAITTLFSEGTETFKAIRACFADGPTTPDKKTETVEEAKSVTHKPSHYLKPLIYALGAIGGFEDMIDSYASVAGTFQVEPTSESMSARILNRFFLAGGTTNGLCEAVFSGKIISDAIDAAYAKIAGNNLQPSEMISAVLATFTGGVLGHIQRSLFLSLLAAPEVALPFVIPEVVVMMLSWGVAARTVLISAIGSYQFYQLGVDTLGHWLTSSKKLEDVELDDFRAPADVTPEPTDAFVYHAIPTEEDEDLIRIERPGPTQSESKNDVNENSLSQAAVVAVDSTESTQPKHSASNSENQNLGLLSASLGNLFSASTQSPGHAYSNPEPLRKKI